MERRWTNLNKEVPVLKLDIIIPIYNEQENLHELHRRLSEVCGKLKNDVSWQVIYVNDGSKDDSLKIMLAQYREDSRFMILDLSRNFGHQAAIAAGLAHADGDAVIFMDGDLQDPPEVIPDLLTRWKDGAQIVRAQRRSRKEQGFRRLGFEVFHRFFKWISDFPIPPHTGIFGLVDRKAVNQLGRFTEKNRFFPGLRSWIGFEQDVIYYDRPERAAGKPKQSFRRLIRYALDAIFSFSYKPLRIMTGAGILVSICGFSLASLFVIRRLAGIEIAQTGFTTLVTLILFLGGVQLVAIGILGEYLARIYDEVKKRPLYIVKNRYGMDMQEK
ncbi:MAG: glycosyltransferase family 2 protein [Thermodesulfobacteriota bacterium]|nr:glycosyltransferase family 2 protein [Thermodesulfobacteriota bacterium]